MFSKALFKQSCKANGVMWGIITFAVCFMLACVMLISGSGSIGETKNAIEDTIIKNEIDSAIGERAINYYSISDEALTTFDKAFAESFNKVDYLLSVSKLVAAGKTQEEAQRLATLGYYETALKKLQQTMLEKAAALGYDENSDEAKEILGVSVFALNPQLITLEDGNEDMYNAYLSHTDDLLEGYDLASLIENSSDKEYLTSVERRDYVSTRAEKAGSCFLAINITSDKAVDEMVKT